MPIKNDSSRAIILEIFGSKSDRQKIFERKIRGKIKIPQVRRFLLWDILNKKKEKKEAIKKFVEKAVSIY